MTRGLFAVVLALAACPARAAYFNTAARGTTTADFLNLGVGARGVGMGGAYSSVVDDAGAMYWNPAALKRIEHRSLTFMHASYIDSSFFDYGAYGQDLGRAGAIGAGIQYFSAGPITQTDASGANAGTFSPMDVAASFGYAVSFPKAEFMPDWSGFSFGVAAKWIQSRILANAGTAAADLGVLSPGYLGDRLRFAFTATNLGGRMKFEQNSAEIPSTVRFGASCRITRNWLVASDLVAPNNDNPHIAAGTEFWTGNSGGWRLAARAGLDSQTMSGISGLTGVSLGFGLAYRKSTSFDYALVPYGALGQAHRISVTFGF